MSDGMLEREGLYASTPPQVEQDYGAEEFEWPDVSGLRPVEAARLLDDIERETAAANKRAKVLASRKSQAKRILDAVMELEELDSIRFTSSEGVKVQYTPYPFDAFSVDDPEQFAKWAETQSESYFDSTPKLREGIFRDEMRRRVQDGEPLPPGVRRWTDTKISRSAVKSKI